jgi:xanthine dehydrogenase YagT iron-sulfur-binding subunit
VTAAGAALSDSGLTALAQERQQQAAAIFHGPDAVPIQLRVNGQDKKLQVEPRTTLAEALRMHLDLTGTKVVCDRGSCSACTVWIDGTPMLSCMTLAIDAQNREITTIEGLASGDELHPVQEQFIEHDAMQCGFCTPGMIMSCAALLARNQNPTAEAVKAACSGNLCRCGTYVGVVEATLAASRSS